MEELENERWASYTSHDPSLSVRHVPSLCLRCCFFCHVSTTESVLIKTKSFKRRENSGGNTADSSRPFVGEDGYAIAARTLKTIRFRFITPSKTLCFLVTCTNNQSKSGNVRVWFCFVVFQTYLNRRASNLLLLVAQLLVSQSEYKTGRWQQSVCSIRMANSFITSHSPL